MITKHTLSEKQILSLLIYPESFSYIRSETGLTYGAVRDDLMNLINHGYIQVYQGELNPVPASFYDTDRIEDYHFKATKTGLKTIQRYAISINP